jgi:hypothetical protein
MAQMRSALESTLEFAPAGGRPAEARQWIEKLEGDVASLRRRSLGRGAPQARPEVWELRLHKEASTSFPRRSLLAREEDRQCAKLTSASSRSSPTSPLTQPREPLGPTAEKLTQPLHRDNSPDPEVAVRLVAMRELQPGGAFARRREGLGREPASAAANANAARGSALSSC